MPPRLASLWNRRRGPGESRPRSRPRPWGRLLLRGLLAGVGVMAGATLLAVVWPEPEPRGVRGPLGLSDLANVPNRPVTVLVIGLDADQLTAADNQAAPPGPANADALLLVRINPDDAVQVLPLPATLAVQLPGEDRPQALGSLYRTGGAALLADAVRDLAGLPAGRPDRYLVLSRGALRSLVEGLGSVEVNPRQTMRYSDRSQDLEIDLQAGVQRLSPEQMEHLARWRDAGKPLESRLMSHRQVVESLHRELVLQGMGADLPGLARKLLGQVNTNLSQGEILSLLAAALRPETSLSFTTLPLAAARQGEAAKATGLRERVAELPNPFWPEPKASTSPQSSAQAP